MKFKHTNRKGFWIGFIDFFTMGIFLLFYMSVGGLQDELDEVLGYKTQRYWKAYLLGLPDLTLYTIHWMAKISEDLKKKAIELKIEGPYTSYKHMFLWNTIGLLLGGPAIATLRFFDTLNKIERKLNEMEDTH